MLIDEKECTCQKNNMDKIKPIGKIVHNKSLKKIYTRKKTILIRLSNHLVWNLMFFNY